VHRLGHRLKRRLRRVAGRCRGWAGRCRRLERRCSGCGPGRSNEPDPGQAVQPHHLDQGPDLRLGPSQEHRPPLGPQPSGEYGDIHHQRRVREHQLAEIDGQIGLGADRPRQGLPAEALRVAILVATAAERRWLFIEVDDGAKLPKPSGGCHAKMNQRSDSSGRCLSNLEQAPASYTPDHANR
jgi:hypothetical protein